MRNKFARLLLGTTAFLLFSGCPSTEDGPVAPLDDPSITATSNIWWPWSRNNKPGEIVLYAGQHPATILIRNTGKHSVVAQSFEKPDCSEAVSKPIELAEEVSVLLSGLCIRVDNANPSLAIQGSAIMLPGHGMYVNPTHPLDTPRGSN